MTTRRVGVSTKGRACDNKRRHASRDAADAAVARMVAQGTRKDAIRPYRCGFCGTWHVGHVPGRGKRMS